MFGHFSGTKRDRRVNGGKYRVSLAAIRVRKREASDESTDGPNFLLGTPESMGAPPPFLGSPIETIIAANGGPILINFRPPRRRRENGVRNRDSLSAIRA